MAEPRKVVINYSVVSMTILKGVFAHAGFELVSAYEMEALQKKRIARAFDDPNNHVVAVLMDEVDARNLHENQMTLTSNTQGLSDWIASLAQENQLPAIVIVTNEAYQKQMSAINIRAVHPAIILEAIIAHVEGRDEPEAEPDGGVTAKVPQSPVSPRAGGNAAAIPVP